MTVAASAFTTLYPERRVASGGRRMTADDLWAIPRVGAPVPSPDGVRFAVPVTSYDMEQNRGRARIWLVPVAGGEPSPLTSPEHSSLEPAFSPDGRRLAFVRKGEDGKGQIHVMPLDGGEPQKITDLPLGAFDPRWLPDGSAIVFAAPVLRDHVAIDATRAELERRGKDPVKAHVTEERVYRFWDVWLTTDEVPHLFAVAPDGSNLRDLTPTSKAWFDWMEPSGLFDVSPDGKELAFSGFVFDAERSLLRSALFTAPIAGGELRCLTERHPAGDSRPRYTLDGRSIVFGMTHDPFFYADRVRLMRHDRSSGRIEPILDSWNLSPSQWEVTPEGGLVFLAEDAGRIHALALDAGARAPRELARGGTITCARRTAQGELLFNLQTLVSPPEIHACPVGGGAARPLTRFTEPAMKEIELGEVREMQFEGAQGETVQMFVMLPPGYRSGTKLPGVQVVHGGPHGISGDAFHFRWNAALFAAPGYVVGMVNFQGSTSWGQDFAKRIQGGWGDRPFTDVMLGTDLLVASGLADEKRLAAAGGSYGGYLVAWIAGHTDRFRCLVNHAGVYDLLAQYASDVTQGRAQSMGGEPWDGLERIDRWNPARFAAGMKTPMLVIHGERDYRVPVSQGLECYGMLKAKGVPARLVYFPDENHWVLKPRNSQLWYREVLGWLARYL